MCELAKFFWSGGYTRLSRGKGGHRGGGGERQAFVQIYI